MEVGLDPSVRTWAWAWGMDVGMRPACGVESHAPGKTDWRSTLLISVSAPRARAPGHAHHHAHDHDHEQDHDHDHEQDHEQDHERGGSIPWKGA